MSSHLYYEWKQSRKLKPVELTQVIPIEESF